MTAPSHALSADAEHLVEARGLKKYFPAPSAPLSRATAYVRAVEDVSFTIRPGEVVGLVGESGSGKSTLGRLLLRLLEPTSGTIFFRGEDLTQLSRAQLRPYRRRLQIIFQDPFGSLSPRMRVDQIIGDALRIHGRLSGEERKAHVRALLRRVGLSPHHARRYPHEFSGGQRQRIGIARALAVRPAFLVADEPVSALDVSIQAQIVNLLQDLKEEMGLAMLFIAHDLGVVRHVSDKVLVMYLGRIMEMAPVKDLYTDPVHPYTEALLASVPTPDPVARRKRILLSGDIPRPTSPPSGCVFHTRCPLAIDQCKQVVPPLVEHSPGHFSACLRRG